MNDTPAPTFQIPKDVIEPIIQSHVAAAVSTALGGHALMVEKAVAQALNVKVDSEGKQSGYRSDIPWLQWVMGECVRKAALEAVQEALIEQQGRIKKEIARELQKVNSPLAKRLIESMAGAIADHDALKYRLTVNIEK